MKYWLVMFFSLLFLISSEPAKADDMGRLVNSLCDFTKSNNRSQMRKKLKQAKIKLKRVYGGITCGATDGFSGGSLLRVATFFGSLDAAKYLVSQIGSGGVQAAESDGSTILAWTEALAASDPSKAANLAAFIELYQSE